MLINTAQTIVDTEGNRITLGDRFTLFTLSGIIVGISLYNCEQNAQLEHFHFPSCAIGSVCAY